MPLVPLVELGLVGSSVRGRWHAGWSAPTGGSVGHGPVTILFLGLILWLVPMTLRDTMLFCMLLYWPPWWRIMVALTVAMAVSRMFY